MFDYNKYTYHEKPFEQMRNHAVYNLDNKGFEEYMSKDGFTHKYLDKFHPKVMDHIFRNSMDVEEPKEEARYKIEHDHKSNDRETHEALGHPTGTLNATTYKPFISNVNQKQNSINDLKGSGFNSKSSNFETKYRKIMPMTKLSSEENPLNILKRKILDGEVNTNNSNNFSKTNSRRMFNSTSKLLKYDGFKVTGIPRVDHLVSQNENQRNNIINNKIFMALKGKDSLIYSQEKEDLSNIIIKENEKLKDVIKSNMNSTFLDQYKLPKIASSPNKEAMLLINTTKDNSNKMMGRRYNPYNYDFAKSQSTTRRNVFGALFEH